MSDVHVRHEIRKLTTDDVDTVAGAMARAFFDDPLQVWIFPDDADRLVRLERMFALQIRYSSLPLGESYTDPSRSCGAFWMPPGEALPEDDLTESAGPLTAIVGADALTRLNAAFTVMRDAHPSAPHFYLAGLGTDPPRQGQGLGSAAIAPVLARCDRDRTPAYLESTKERNVAFYERHGFRVTSTIAAPPDGPPMWLMWRDPLVDER
jgi:ribosomal protein S18 acetylase RimI-like enzyme